MRIVDRASWPAIPHDHSLASFALPDVRATAVDRMYRRIFPVMLHKHTVQQMSDPKMRGSQT